MMGGEILSTGFQDQIFCLLSNASFASEQECIEVSRSIISTMFVPDILPYVTSHYGRQLADRCLVSLSWFQNAIQKRSRFHGAPSIDFYRTVGKTAFKNDGHEDICAHFEKWEGFLSELG